MLNRVIVAYVFALLLLPLFVWSQQSTIPVTLTVVDRNGVPIQGVQLRNTPGVDGPHFPHIETKTDPDGRLTVDLLPLTTYTVTFTLNGKNLGFQHLPVPAISDRTSPLTLRIAALDRVVPLWNSWAADEENETEQSELKAGNLYTINFDIAGVDYNPLSSESSFTAVPDERLTALLRSKPNPALIYKPFIQGEGLELVPEAAEKNYQDVDTDILEKTPGTVATIVGNIKPGTELPKLAELSKLLAAFHVGVKVRATQPGRALVGLALWDAASLQPLEFLTFAATVSSPYSHSQPPGMQVQTPPFQAGLHNLLGSPTATPAAAGLSVFELGNIADGSLRNTVIFLGRKTGDEYFLRSWNPRRSIREYVSLDGQFGMTRQLELIQCRENFPEIADFFSGVLFSAPDKEGQKAAQESLQELESLLESWPGTDPPVISTRFVDAAGGSLPLPLGALGVTLHKKEQMLAEVATISQPLPVDRPVADEGCIKDITTILPASLGLGDGCECAALDHLLQPLEPPGGKFIQDIETVGKYFTQPAEAREGLLLVSHHADGFISFTANFSDALQAEKLTREYKEGSVAMLVGCTVGSLTPLNRSLPLVRTLNERGVDAMIMSPFTLSATLGARLGVYFSKEIEDARGGPPFTFLSLYRKVLQDVRNDKAAKPFLGELNLLSLSGNGNIQLCPVKTSRSQVPASLGKDPRCTCNPWVWVKEKLCGGMARILNPYLGPSATAPKSGVGVGAGERANAKACREATP